LTRIPRNHFTVFGSMMRIQKTSFGAPLRLAGRNFALWHPGRKSANGPKHLAMAPRYPNLGRSQAGPRLPHGMVRQPDEGAWFPGPGVETLKRGRVNARWTLPWPWAFALGRGSNPLAGKPRAGGGFMLIRLAGGRGRLSWTIAKTAPGKAHSGYVHRQRIGQAPMRKPPSSVIALSQVPGTVAGLALALKKPADP